MRTIDEEDVEVFDLERRERGWRGRGEMRSQLFTDSGLGRLTLIWDAEMVDTEMGRLEKLPD